MVQLYILDFIKAYRKNQKVWIFRIFTKIAASQRLWAVQTNASNHVHSIIDNLFDPVFMVLFQGTNQSSDHFFSLPVLHVMKNVVKGIKPHRRITNPLNCKNVSLLTNCKLSM